MLSEADTFAILVDLAVALINSSGARDGLDFRQRRVVLSTRIVHLTENGTATFSLPIFEQWFGGQALLQRQAVVGAALANARSFDRWRWALAVGVVSSEEGQVDDLVESTLRLNPGAGAWLISQVSASSDERQRDIDLDPENVGARILRAIRAWVDSLGATSTLVFPLSSPSDPIRLSVEVSDDWVTEGWSGAPATSDQVKILPPTGELRRDAADWRFPYGGLLPKGYAWPWTRVHSQVARAMLPILEANLWLDTPGSLWNEEVLYHLSRSLLRSSSALHAPIATSDVLTRLEAALRAVESPEHVEFVIGRESFPGATLLKAMTSLLERDVALLERPVPAPDMPLSNGPWVWSLYSAPQLVAYCSSVFGSAAQIYDELADTLFVNFQWSLGKSAFRPFGVLGVVDDNEEEAALGPVVRYEQLPWDLYVARRGERDDFLTSPNGRAAMRLRKAGEDDHGSDADDGEALRTWIREAGIQGPFLSLSAGWSVIETKGNRPASDRAADWLFDDLKKLDLADGTFPRLGGA